MRNFGFEFQQFLDELSDWISDQKYLILICALICVGAYYLFTKI